MLAIFSMGGPWEYIIVLVIILILWGPGKLPQVLSQLGKGVRSFKDGMKDGEDTKTIDAKEEEAETHTETVNEAEEVRKG